MLAPFFSTYDAVMKETAQDTAGPSPRRYDPAALLSVQALELGTLLHKAVFSILSFLLEGKCSSDWVRAAAEQV